VIEPGQASELGAFGDQEPVAVHRNYVVSAVYVQLRRGSQLVWLKPLSFRASTAYAIKANIMVIGAQNHCIIRVSAGISTYRPKVLCSATRPSGPNRPAINTPGLGTHSSSALAPGLPSWLRRTSLSPTAYG
jgi:hypothetical protein